MEGKKEKDEVKDPRADTVKDEKDEGISKGTKEKITGLIADRLLPEVIKRGLESGLEAILSPDVGLKRIIPDLKIRREFAEYMIRQIDETKNLTLRVVASEVRSFLENTNMEDALRKVLTSLAFEIKTEVRFISTENGKIRPRVKSGVVKQKKPKKKTKTTKKKKSKK